MIKRFLALCAALILGAGLFWAISLDVDSPVVKSPVASVVVRSTFTTAIREREPVDNITNLSVQATQVSYFSEVRDLEGHTLTHQWRWNGKVMAEIPFKIKGARWRVWSNKTLSPQLKGQWSVAVVDENGRVLAKDTLTVTP